MWNTTHLAALAYVVGLAATPASAPAPALTASSGGLRPRLLHVRCRLRPPVGADAAAGRGSRRLTALRAAAAHHKEKLHALPAREILAQLREGAFVPS
jgi:hypothetical protein